VRDVITVVHAFQEESETEQQCHLEEWFGYDPPSGNPQGAVCACGATSTVIAKDGSVVAVWHRRSWDPWKQL
jgi:hypothetical protein